jgi:hypothetical protein
MCLCGKNLCALCAYVVKKLCALCAYVVKNLCVLCAYVVKTYVPYMPMW